MTLAFSNIGATANIDERLDKLTARHEALAQSLEILTHEVDELKGSMVELRESVGELRETVRESNTGTMSILQGLLEVARNHENRIFA